MMLIPGKRGADFRTEVAQLVLAYLNADPAIADDILQRTTKENQEWLAYRANGIVGRRALTDAIKAAGITDTHFYSNVSQLPYKALFDKSPSKLREERGVQDIRSSLSSEELNAIEFIERGIAKRIGEMAPHHDSKEIYQAVKKLAYEIAEYSSVPFAAAS